MQNIAITTRFARTILIAALAVALPVAVAARLRAEEKNEAAEVKPAKLAQQLIGTWQYVGLANTENQPDRGNGLKFFTGKHWNVTFTDDAGNVLFHHGGTYKIDGDQYEETIKYAGQGTTGLIGKTFKFKIKIEDDKYTQIGIDNPYSENWKRAE